MKNQGVSTLLYEVVNGTPTLYCTIVGRLTQLIALTGSSGTWRKTLIDKAIS